MEEINLTRETSPPTPKVMKKLKEVLQKEILTEIYTGEKMKEELEVAKVLKKFSSMDETSSTEHESPREEKDVDKIAT